MTTNETKGNNALKIYYDAIPSQNNPFSSFSDLVSYYSTDQYLLKNFNEIANTGFLERFGSAVSDLNNQTKLKTAMVNLANNTTKNKIPSTSAFYNALSGAAVTFTAADFKKATVEGLKQTASTVGGVVSAGIGMYLMWLTIGLIAFYFFNKKTKAM